MQSCSAGAESKVIRIVNEIALIDALTSLFFIMAVLISFRNYNKSKAKDSLWLIIGMNFAFLFMMSVSNVLEWGGITTALDPAEDFISVLVISVWVYIFSKNV